VSGRIEGIQAEFGRLSDGKIDPSTVYASDFFGRKTRGSSIVVEGEGDAFVGVSGAIRDGFDGLRFKRNMSLSTEPLDGPSAQADATRTLPRAGGQASNVFHESAPAGGFLVGMRLFVGRSWGGTIQGVQPIYQVDGAYRLGKRYGPDGGLARQLLAKPGYAVGKLDARAGLVLNSLRFRFERLSENGLDSADSYDSQTVGSPGGGQFVLNAAEHFIVGVNGSFHDDMTSIEVVVAD